MTNKLSQGSEQGNKDLASYLLKEFPPPEIWKRIKPDLSPQTAENLKNLYLWGGTYLDEFLAQKESSLPNSDLTEEFRIYVKSKATLWLLQGNLLFQAEEYIKSEFELENQGKTYPWRSWSSLNKKLVFEEFSALIATQLTDFWESLPVRTMEESRRDAIAYLNGLMKEENFKRVCNNYEKSKDKLKNSFSDSELKQKLMPWTSFCFRVFNKYKDELPGYLPWVEFSYGEGLPQLTKFALINGQFKKYPGRGKTKP